MDAIEHLIHVAEDRGDEKLGGIAWGRMATSARTELSALKARVEAAEGLLGEAYAAMRERQHHARHGSTFFCPDCGSEKTEAKPHRSYCGLGKLLSRIDAALQAAREGVVRASDPEWFKTDPPMRSKLTGWNPMSDGGSE